MAFLELDHVSVVFPAVQGLLSARKSAPVVAVDGVSLSVEKGEILGLVGESGCGKSTLSRTVMLLQKPTEGRIFLEGEELTALSSSEVRKRRPDFQMVFQDPYASLNPRFTVYATLKEALQSRRKRTFAQTRDDVAELMEKVGLSPSMNFPEASASASPLRAHWRRNPGWLSRMNPFPRWTFPSSPRF